MSAHREPTPLAMLADSMAELRADVRDRFDRLDAKIDRVETHTSATNGRVGRLELWKATMDGARGAYSWVLPVCTSLVSGGAITFIVLALEGKL